MIHYPLKPKIKRTAKTIKRNQKTNKLLNILKNAHIQNNTNFHTIQSKYLQKSIRMHVLPSSIIERSWEKQDYASTSFFSSIITFDGIIAMSNSRKRKTWEIRDLTKLLTIEPSERANLFECCTSDACLDIDCLAIVAVFWVEMNQSNRPLKCFGTVFRVTSSLEISLIKMIECPSMVGYCRLTVRSTSAGNQHCLLVFPKGNEVAAYKVDSMNIEKIEDVFEWFPSLALTKLPGGALRTSCIISGEYRFSAVGLDNGALIVSVSLVQGNVILRSIKLKFATPVTIVEFLPDVSETIKRILVSSYLGPAAIWRIHFVDDQMQWEFESILEESQNYDAVLCSCVYRFYHGCPPWILLGTYSGMILRYELPTPTTHVRRRTKSIKMIGDPLTELKNKPIYSIKQSGINEICAVTPFGMRILVEDVFGKKLVNRYKWILENYQLQKLWREKWRKVDFCATAIQRASIESDSPECRQRTGSTLSNFTNRTTEDEIGGRRRMTMPTYPNGKPPFIATSNSSSKLKHLDLNTSTYLYSDTPPESQIEIKSPNKVQAASPRMGPIQEISPPTQVDRKANRFVTKKSLSHSDQPMGRFFK